MGSGLRVWRHIPLWLDRQAMPANVTDQNLMGVGPLSFKTLEKKGAIHNRGQLGVPRSVCLG